VKFHLHFPDLGNIFQDEFLHDVKELALLTYILLGLAVCGTGAILWMVFIELPTAIIRLPSECWDLIFKGGKDEVLGLSCIGAGAGMMYLLTIIGVGVPFFLLVVIVLFCAVLYLNAIGKFTPSPANT
jgi:hypothetical protein